MGEQLRSDKPDPLLCVQTVKAQRSSSLVSVPVVRSAMGVGCGARGGVRHIREFLRYLFFSGPVGARCGVLRWWGTFCCWDISGTYIRRPYGNCQLA